MTTATSSNKDWIDVYDGFDSKEVGAGTIDPNIYATTDYAKLKTQNILIGGLNKLVYAPFFNDITPLVLVIAYEVKYNTIIGWNLRYIPYKARKAIIDLVIKSNIPRIKAKKPMIINYNMVKRALPISQNIVRRYKLVALRVTETIPLKAWGTAIQESSKWQNQYKK